MGISNSNKEIGTSKIECGGDFRVKLTLTAQPDITTNPTDIVLVLDRSGSMSGSPLANLKAGAKKFIDIIEESTDGVSDGEIGSRKPYRNRKFCYGGKTGYAAHNLRF